MYRLAVSKGTLRAEQCTVVLSVCKGTLRAEQCTVLLSVRALYVQINVPSGFQ
jgi:hypothetical protein